MTFLRITHQILYLFFNNTNRNQSQSTKLKKIRIKPRKNLIIFESNILKVKLNKTKKKIDN